MNKYIPLQNLLCSDRHADLPLVKSASRLRSWSDWRRRIEQWRQLLADHSGVRFALYDEDAFEFSAVLFALWAENKIACVPGSNLPQVANQLATRVDGFIGDFGNKECLQCDRSAPVDWQNKSTQLDENRMVLEVYTSGSTGEPTAINKELSQISNEVHNLNAVWGELLNDAVIFGTVSHHHIYGMLFRVFLPLARGLCFHPDVCEFFEEVQRLATPFNKIALISSPTHLTRIPRSNWQALQDRCVAIYSSGAPLPAEGSADSRERFGLSPCEVFGSSETGGVAWRQQAADRNVPWQPFPGVEVAIEPTSQCLQIKSPYLPLAVRDEWYLTPDMVVIDEGRSFQLRGRADSIVKVEGKRVSLTDIERRLNEHGWVSACKLLLVEGRRTEIGAIVELSADGLRELEEGGRRKINKTLQDYLSDQFDRPVLPRRWRYCDRLPYNNQGKLVRDTLLEFFV